MNKRLLITSTDLMMVQFLIPHVIHLSQNGFDVEIACSDVGGRMDEVREKLKDSVKAIHVVRLVRSPASPTNLKGFGDMRKVIENGNYDIIWTNEPVMGVVTRLAARDARKRGTKVLYMVHGFHFYKGAPKPYWLTFYPIEKAMAHHADVICTVNQEDFNRAKTFNVKRVEYIHGIGINTERLTPSANRNDIRAELGLSSEDFIVLSVGELNENKNQKTIIRAMQRLQDPQIHYVLCGKGDQLEALQQQAADAGLMERVHFLGYRKDVVDICSQADVFVMPSHREGLPVASLEAMYCGLPVIASNIRGLTDIVKDSKSGFIYDPDDAEGFAEGIRTLKENPALRKACGKYNRTAMEPFVLEKVKKEVLELLQNEIDN